MSEPPVQWFERLSRDAPRKRLTGVLQTDYLIPFASARDAASDDIAERLSAGYKVLTDLVRESSPCKRSRLSRQEISERVLSVFRVENTPPSDSGEKERPGEERGVEVKPSPPRPENPQAEARAIMNVAAPGAIDILRRIDRLMVDRELSLRVLELRREKAASRDRRWPAILSKPGSRVCPEVSFVYEQKGGGMKLRFPGYAGDSDASGLVLPLSYEARSPEPTPEPAGPPTAVPAPRRPSNPASTP